jgi:hypothetical protein
MSDKQKVAKVTLSSGKVVHLREMRIKHTETAAELAGPRAGENRALLGMLVQKELLKLLILDVDGRKLSGTEVEDLDALFTFGEYSQLLKVVDQLTGGAGDMGKQAQLEIVSYGNK